jgi:uncharacterized protein (TIGR03118 family)
MPYTNKTVINSSDDPMLINPFGLTILNEIVYVAIRAKSKITLYDLNFIELGKEILIEDNEIKYSPTAIVNNTSTGFLIKNQTTQVELPSEIIIVTDNGAIFGYNKLVNPDYAILCLKQQECSFVGVEQHNNLLYVCNLVSRNILTYNSNYELQQNYPFPDNNIPEKYAPFNIKIICDKLYITYNKITFDEPLIGFINVYDYNGNFIKNFSSDAEHLSSPYGLCLMKCGKYNDCLIIGNYASGLIDAFDKHGKFQGNFKNSSGEIINISGLTTMIYYKPNKFIYYTASTDGSTGGAVGYIYAV